MVVMSCLVLSCLRSRRRAAVSEQKDAIGVHAFKNNLRLEEW